MAKMKAEMDQFKEGLNVLGFLDTVKRNPDMWEPFFMYRESEVTVGRILFTIIIFIMVHVHICPNWSTFSCI